MTLDPATFWSNPDLVETIEKATLRLVVQAVYDFRESANEIFVGEQDLVADIGEDITREALDRLGTSTIPVRLFGKIDYKRARYIFHPEYSTRQALFVDSKAEKIEGSRTATIQLAQTSMRVRQRRAGETIDQPGGLPIMVERQGNAFLTTTIFVKYNYRSAAKANELVSISFVCLPNGILQDQYNPDPDDTFWRAGRNAPSLGEAFRVRIGLPALKRKANWRVQPLGEAFRVRIGLPALKRKANWRVQQIQLVPTLAYTWDD